MMRSDSECDIGVMQNDCGKLDRAIKQIKLCKVFIKRLRKKKKKLGKKVETRAAESKMSTHKRKTYKIQFFFFWSNKHLFQASHKKVNKQYFFGILLVRKVSFLSV